MAVGSPLGAQTRSGDADPYLWPVLAGALVFLGNLALGLALTVLVVRSIFPQVPRPTEAHDGFGDAMMALVGLAFGAALSLLVAVVLAVIVGVAVAAWAASRKRDNAP